MIERQGSWQHTTAGLQMTSAQQSRGMHQVAERVHAQA